MQLDAPGRGGALCRGCGRRTFRSGSRPQVARPVAREPAQGYDARLGGTRSGSRRQWVSAPRYQVFVRNAATGSTRGSGS
jgi:hypothetical protein